MSLKTTFLLRSREKGNVLIRETVRYFDAVNIITCCDSHAHVLFLHDEMSVSYCV